MIRQRHPFLRSNGCRFKRKVCVFYYEWDKEVKGEKDTNRRIKGGSITEAIQLQLISQCTRKDK